MSQINNLPAITEKTKNEKSLTNISNDADITVDEATMLVNDANRPVDSLGLPVTKTSENTKSLTNDSENT